MNPLARTVTAAAAGLTLMAGLAACTASAQAPAPAVEEQLASSIPTTSPGDLPAAPRPLDDSTGETAPVHTHPPVSPTHVPVDDDSIESDEGRLRRLWLADPPVGPGPEIALRFLQALQDRDHLRAARELYIAGRSLLSGRDMTVLHQVMDDVTANAQLHAAGRCTTAAPVGVRSAVVTCGQQQVIVHVLNDEYSSGVQISDRHPDIDSYAGPHTHAFTTINP